MLRVFLPGNAPAFSRVLASPATAQTSHGGSRTRVSFAGGQVRVEQAGPSVDATTPCQISGSGPDGQMTDCPPDFTQTRTAASIGFGTMGSPDGRTGEPDNPEQMGEGSPTIIAVGGVLALGDAGVSEPLADLRGGAAFFAIGPTTPNKMKGMPQYGGATARRFDPDSAPANSETAHAEAAPGAAPSHPFR